MVPAAEAIAAARSTAGIGVSSCMSRTSADSMAVRAASTSSTDRRALAPGATEMAFSPASSTMMRATPVG